jgi:signal transduction histidine kinase
MTRVNLKNRLSAGFGLLLMLVVLLWITGTYFIYNLSNRSAAMLKENYQTVESTKFLIQSIDEIKNEQLADLFRENYKQNDSLSRASLIMFTKNLEAVRNNITEDGEAELIRELENDFHAYLSVYDSLKDSEITTPESFHHLISAYSTTRNYIIALWDLNMKAISYKNSLIKNTSHRAFVIMSLIGSVCFIISVLFFFRYPGYIANPITQQAEAKTNFIATISHELKTPISSLRLNLKLLDDPRIGELNEEQRDIIHALKEETLKMSGITSELLDLAQVETGNVPLNFQPVAPAEIIRYVKNPALNQAKSKHIQINFSVPDPLPEMYCDSEKTAWVLLNMLNNAILYSPDGSSIEVEVKQMKDSIRFMVRDFGMGIEEQYLQQIFEKYFRVPDSGQKGTGLGLAISKEFISKQQGNIWVESAPGKGSKFFFDLPVYRNYTGNRIKSQGAIF